MNKWIYHFGAGSAEGSMSLKRILGGKGACLADMSALGLPVPAGFTITTDVCNHYFHQDTTWPEGLEDDLGKAIVALEEKSEKKFGCSENPLLVSVRSGAPVSMPGMMDTILNLGLNDDTTEALAKKTGNEKFAYESKYCCVYP